MKKENNHLQRDKHPIADRIKAYFSIHGLFFLCSAILLVAFFIHTTSPLFVHPDSQINESFRCIFGKIALSRQAVYSIAVILLSLVVVLGTALFINPKKIKLPVYIIVTVCGILCFRILDYNVFQDIPKTIQIRNRQTSEAVSVIEPSCSNTYPITITGSAFDTLKVYLDGDSILDSHVTLTRHSDGEVCYSGDVRLADIVTEEKEKKRAVCIRPLGRSPVGEYSVEITNSGQSSLWVSTMDDGTLNFAASCHTFLGGKLAVCVCLILILCAVSVYILCQYGLSIDKWFLATVIPLSILYLLLFVPWSHPDTESHLYATYRFSNILLGYPQEDLWKGRQEDADFFQYVWGTERNPRLKHYEGVRTNAHIFCEKPEIVDLPKTEDRMSFYSIFSYLPQVLGFTLGRLLHLSTVYSLYLSRIFVLLVYIGTIYWNIKKIPSGKWIIATVALLPMSLMMSSSISYDAMVIISTLNFISCIFRSLKEQKSKSTYAETLLWSFMLGAVKGGGYLLLLPMVLILFSSDEKKQSVYRMLGIVAIGLFSVLLFDKILAPVTGFQFGQEGGKKLSVAFAFQEPLRYFDMAMYSYINTLDLLAINTGGTALAWLEQTLPAAVVCLFMFVGGILSIFENDEITLRKDCKIPLVLIIVIGLLATPAMLLSWTTKGSVKVQGMQGRYFLPLLPLFFYVQTKFSLHTPNKTNSAAITKKGIGWMTALAILSVVYIMILYLTR